MLEEKSSHVAREALAFKAWMPIESALRALVDPIDTNEYYCYTALAL